MTRIESALDFAGPYLTTQGQGKTRAKRYLRLFLCLPFLPPGNCLVFRNRWFLQALTRMVAVRVLPSTMLSNNGTYFVGSYNEILEHVVQIGKEKVNSKTSNKRLQ